MTTVLTEHSDEVEAEDRFKTWIGFIVRFAVTHTVVYFIAGMIFSVVMNYRELFATPEYAYMRPFDHPLVILGPSLQIFRGALLAVAFLPFRKVIIESKRGWLYIFVAMLILMHIGADAADPGKIEAFIYADYSLAVHVSTWPESIFSSLVFAWLFYTWERNPKDKRLTIPLIAIFIITLAVAVLGLLFTSPA
ncbi:hypothetical protein ACFLV7_06295 [Chloroflexota bacterium]